MDGAPRKYKTSERRALGLCIRCDTPSNRYYCPVHAAHHRHHQNSRKGRRNDDVVHLKGKPGYTICGYDIVHNTRQGQKRTRKEPLQTAESFDQASCLTCRVTRSKAHELPSLRR